jgi:hypothetical protein
MLGKHLLAGQAPRGRERQLAGATAERAPEFAAGGKAPTEAYIDSHQSRHTAHSMISTALGTFTHGLHER